MKYHHLGIPTDKPFAGERYIPHLKMYVRDYSSGPYGIEWIRFDEDADFPELVKTVPHVAFEVEDLQKALIGKKVIVEPNSPSPGLWVAMIEDNDAPVELMQIDHDVFKE